MGIRLNFNLILVFALRKKMGGEALASPPPCPWVVLKVLQSC
ncbi:hypothetical protein SBA5_70117 [Candidatus Sulfotelmatomonas gaucii]|uniref:Uncharacterized protein n=1 Tax=Candidatus Sulfuritelmatomonas gaucii TaxID=2043161 RepID=A0A2N9M0P4_9BACT|nr:hypothetical protein SBA5_70117 [Candidatus Sulfotelmatomonas gaucii]